MPAPTGNTNATKPAAERSSVLHFVRCHPDELRAWKRAARKTRDNSGRSIKLSQWTRDQLNRAAQP